MKKDNAPSALSRVVTLDNNGFVDKKWIDTYLTNTLGAKPHYDAFFYDLIKLFPAEYIALYLNFTNTFSLEMYYNEFCLIVTIPYILTEEKVFSLTTDFILTMYSKGRIVNVLYEIKEDNNIESIYEKLGIKFY